MERMSGIWITQLEADLMKKCKELEEENKKLKEAMKELNNYNKFRIQENERLKEEIKLFNSFN